MIVGVGRAVTLIVICLLQDKFVDNELTFKLMLCVPNCIVSSQVIRASFDICVNVNQLGLLSIDQIKSAILSMLFNFHEYP
jgi:hypothetical protein